jgi:hypothetical protein
LSGTIGDKEYRQLPDGRTIETKRHDFSKREFSQGQLETQARFKRAVQYAREASTTQPLYAALAEGQPVNAYNLALADWLKPPVIHAIQRSGASVRVRASDNILVADVYIKILDGQGNVLEQGHARKADPAYASEVWEYRSSATDGTVEATACDLAGNQVKAVL